MSRVDRWTPAVGWDQLNNKASATPSSGGGQPRQRRRAPHRRRLPVGLGFFSIGRGTGDIFAAQIHPDSDGASWRTPAGSRGGQAAGTPEVRRRLAARGAHQLAALRHGLLLVVLPLPARVAVLQRRGEDALHIGGLHGGRGGPVRRRTDGGPSGGVLGGLQLSFGRAVGAGVRCAALEREGGVCMF